MAFGDLTTLDNVKTWLTPAPPAGDDPLLSRLITAGSDFIHRYLSRFIPLADYEEVRDGPGGQTLSFANTPVIAVRSVMVSQSFLGQANPGILTSVIGTGALTIGPSPDGIAAGYLFTPTAITLRGFSFPRGRQNVTLAYTAGFAATPAAVEQACIELVSLRYRERGREGVIQENIVGVSSTTFRVIDLTPSSVSGLDPYRQVAPVSPHARQFARPSELIV